MSNENKNEKSNLIVIFKEEESYKYINSKEEIYCWNKTDLIDLKPGTYYYRDVETNFYNCYPISDGSYLVDYPYTLGDKHFYKIIEESNYCVSCGVDMGYSNPRQYCRKTYCPYEKNE